MYECSTYETVRAAHCPRMLGTRTSSVWSPRWKAMINANATIATATTTPAGTATTAKMYGKINKKLFRNSVF